MKKLRANALFLVIAIALVIGLLTSSLILLAYHHRLLVLHTKLMGRLVVNANSSLKLLLSESYPLEYGTSKSIDLFGAERDSVLLKKLHWGLFEVGISKAFSGSKSVGRIIQYGYKPDTSSNTVIYLAQGKCLYVSGNTQINGNVFVPGAKVQPGNVEPFTGNQLVNGVRKESSSTLPPLNKPILDNLLSYFQPEAAYKQNCRVMNDLAQDTIIRSFEDSTLLVEFSNYKTISSKIIKGNVILYSDTVITIDPSSRINDVLICSSALIVKAGFKGNFQAFCTDSIIIENNCILDYPSALGILKMDYKTSQPFISLEENSSLKGILISHQNVSDTKQTRITLEDSTYVEGDIYTDGLIEPKGTIHGSVICNNFIINTPSLSNTNYLLNTVLDVYKRSSYYVGSGIINTGNEKELVKWLY